MNSIECKAFKQLQHSVGKSDAQDQLSGWVVRTGRQGVYYLHEESSLSFLTLGAARVAMHALKHNVFDGITGTDHDDYEDGERAETLNLCCCLDGVIDQLHKQVKVLQSYPGQPQKSLEVTWNVQSKIV